MLHALILRIFFVKIAMFFSKIYFISLKIDHVSIFYGEINKNGAFCIDDKDHNTDTL